MSDVLSPGKAGGMVKVEGASVLSPKFVGEFSPGKPGRQPAARGVSRRSGNRDNMQNNTTEPNMLLKTKEGSVKTNPEELNSSPKCTH